LAIDARAAQPRVNGDIVLDLPDRADQHSGGVPAHGMGYLLTLSTFGRLLITSSQSAIRRKVLSDPSLEVAGCGGFKT
jgi:hypothetical protein